VVAEHVDTTVVLGYKQTKNNITIRTKTANKCEIELTAAEVVIGSVVELPVSVIVALAVVLLGGAVVDAVVAAVVGALVVVVRNCGA